MVSTEEIRELSDFLALVYHEARNVRHLVHAGYLPAGKWSELINLPANRLEAWRALQPTRVAAASASSATAAQAVFHSRFAISLADLSELYGNGAWRHARQFGGSAWLHPTRILVDLVPALDSTDPRYEHLFLTLRESRHNNGFVAEKLRSLDAAL